MRRMGSIPTLWRILDVRPSRRSGFVLPASFGDGESVRARSKGGGKGVSQHRRRERDVRR